MTGAANTVAGYDLESLCPEDKLLLACAVTEINEDQRQHIRELTSQKLDWNYVIQQISEYKLVPLAYRALNGVDHTLVPSAVMNHLRAYHEMNKRHSLMLCTELLRLLGLLKQNGVVAVSFKGPVLALMAYGDIAGRYYLDLDILVPDTDIDRAKETLAKEGYLPIKPLDRSAEKILRRWGYGYTLRNPRNKIIVELHWRIAPTFLSFPLEKRALWKRQITVPLLDNTVQSFSPEDTFLILCVHGTKHYWHRLTWLSDVVELLRRHKDLDWDYIVENAQKLHIRRILLLTLFLAERLLNAKIPEALSREARADKTVAVLAERVQRWLFTERIIPINQFEGYIYQFKVREYWWDKVLYLRIKQPMMNQDGLDPKVPPRPQTDLPLYYLLLFLRYMRQFIVNPLKQLLRKGLQNRGM